MSKIEDSTGDNKVNSWRVKAEYRRKNRKWLGYSGKIALRIIAAVSDIPGMNQRKLSELLEVSPQQVSKIIKGSENLTLKTIATLSEVLGVELISFPAFKYNQLRSIEVTIEASINVYFDIQVNIYNVVLVNHSMVSQNYLYNGFIPSQTSDNLITL